MNILVLGGGPAGLYAALLIKKANPSHEITILERNPADVTYGWGVVFSDRTLASFQRVDYKSYEQITNHFVIWDAIDIHYRNEIIRCGGHIIASIARKDLLYILQSQCIELGIHLKFSCEITDLADLPAYDLLIAADGLNSIVRKTYAAQFLPGTEMGKARYIWLGTNKILDAFTFLFRENEHGLFQVHAYPSTGTGSTFIVECHEETWLRAGLDKASESESLAYCEKVFAKDLDGSILLSNNSRWISFPTLKTKNWHYQNMVLLGDAVHTAHFSIGSGTKLAMEDAIALASTLEQHSDLEAALNAYELERKPVVETFQKAATESQTYFETIKRYLGLEPMQFAFQLLTRSGRISYDDLKLRDSRFGDAIDRWFQQKTSKQKSIIAPSPLFAPLHLRTMTIPNRLVLQPVQSLPAENGLLNDSYIAQFTNYAQLGAGLLLTEPVAISASGRITPACIGMYGPEHLDKWTSLVKCMHDNTSAKIALQLNHAGRRGSTRPRSEGLDKPLREGNWPLVSASPIPYTPQSQLPGEIQRDDMERIRDEFVHAAQMAEVAGFDLLQLNFAHGYLLASLISPLTNQRQDEFGGPLEQRMRYPLEVFDSVRAVWSETKPLAVALSATDYLKDGLEIEDAICIAQLLKEHGCDIIAIQAGQTTMDGEPPYGRGFLTPLSDRIRNEAGIFTMVGGYLTTANEINTILAAGRADLCIINPSQLNTQNWAIPEAE